MDEAQSAPPPPPRPVNAAEMVKGPAIALMVVAILAALMGLLSVAFHLLGISLGGLSSFAGGSGSSGLMSMMSGGIGIALNLVGLGIDGFIIFGALKMKGLENYNMAMAAAIVAMLPCHGCCCILGLAAGIWALVILMKPEVKSAFRA